ncbi:MAG: sigma-70 factor domain-containing protein, partial [Microcoleaceae cyanobacterium]
MNILPDDFNLLNLEKQLGSEDFPQALADVDFPLNISPEIEMFDGDELDEVVIAQPKSQVKNTTDLVRLYLQEIGRVNLLDREQEVLEAKKVQQYVHLLELRQQAAATEEGIMGEYVRLIAIHDRLTAKLGHRPSLEKWAEATELSLPELKLTMATGKRCWADLAGLRVEDLEKILANGTASKQLMINSNLRLVVSVAKKYQN